MDRERAKEILFCLVQEAGDLECDTRLHKAFYYAHLWYHRLTGLYLTDWPIVHMPHGPGIDQGEELVAELEADGRLVAEPTRVGPYQTSRYRALGRSKVALREEELEAVRLAAEHVKSHTSGELSAETHQFSRSWLRGASGAELNIYVDLLSDEDYRAGKRRREAVEASLARVWP